MFEKVTNDPLAKGLAFVRRGLLRAACRPAGGCARPLLTVRGSRQSHAKKADPAEHRPYAFLHCGISRNFS